MKAMTSITNPWDDMQRNTIRRIDSEIIHDLFWMKDQSGNYCFYIKSSKEFLETDIDINLKGITIIKRNKDDLGELFLLINNQSDWELFLTLCNDITVVCAGIKDSDEMILGVENRLKHWQMFLMQNNGLTFSLTSQMGLFAELLVLKNILISNIGVKSALISWVGPDFDKQDFTLANFIIEVKSYISSKGPKVVISSAHQLFSFQKPLYLIAIGLTLLDKGVSVIDLIDEITEIIHSENLDIFQSFEKKLINYGFMPGLNYNNIYKFHTDNSRIFEVTDDFPKILPHQINPKIVALNYTIDLQLCTEYESSLPIINNL